MSCNSWASVVEIFLFQTSDEAESCDPDSFQLLIINHIIWKKQVDEFPILYIMWGKQNERNENDIIMKAFILVF